MGTWEFYRVERKAPVAFVFLARPEKRNAMNAPAWRECPLIFQELDEDASVRVVVVAAEGQDFCAGIDFLGMAKELPELSSREQLGAVKWSLMHKIRELQAALTAIERCRKPVIAAVHGHCIGAGLDLATACDIRLCSSDARFSLREAAMGFVADVGVLQRLPLIVGQGITRELAFTARTIDAARAKEILLVSEVYPDRQSLLLAAEAMANEIAANSPLAVQASKEVLNYCIGKSVEEGLQHVAAVSASLIPSDDLFEAMQAFVEKRKPVFR